MEVTFDLVDRPALSELQAMYGVDLLAGMGCEQRYCAATQPNPLRCSSSRRIACGRRRAKGRQNKRLSFAAEHFNERRGHNSGGVRRHVAQLVEQALPVYCAELIESDLSALSLKAYRHPC